MSSVKRFSIAVQGNGRFLSMVITDGMKQFPRAQWFDRSDQANRAIKGEVGLGVSGLLNQASEAIWGPAQKNLKSPVPTDLTITVQSRPTGDAVSVSGRRGRKQVMLGGPGATMQSIESQVGGLMQTIDSMI